MRKQCAKFLSQHCSSRKLAEFCWVAATCLARPVYQASLHHTS